ISLSSPRRRDSMSSRITSSVERLPRSDSRTMRAISSVGKLAWLGITRRQRATVFPKWQGAVPRWKFATERRGRNGAGMRSMLVVVLAACGMPVVTPDAGPSPEPDAGQDGGMVVVFRYLYVTLPGTCETARHECVAVTSDDG